MPVDAEMPFIIRKIIIISTFALNSFNLYSVDYSLFHVITYCEIIRSGKEGWDDMQKSEKQYLHKATV